MLQLSPKESGRYHLRCCYELLGYPIDLTLPISFVTSLYYVSLIASAIKPLVANYLHPLNFLA